MSKAELLRRASVCLRTPFRMENARQYHVIDYSDYRSDPVVDRRITDLAV
jgi:hypothetical protein